MRPIAVFCLVDLILLAAVATAAADPAPRQVQISIQRKVERRDICLALPSTGTTAEAVHGDGDGRDARETYVRIGRHARGRDETVSWQVRQTATAARLDVNGTVALADLSSPIQAYSGGDVAVTLKLGCAAAP